MVAGAEPDKAAEHVALGCLARREHSAEELRQKLRGKGYTEEVIESLLAHLQQQNLQSDARFTEAYIRYRQTKGFGPIRITHELRQKGVAQTLIDLRLNDGELPWATLIARVRSKRFGRGLPTGAAETAKQRQFLLYRGFSAEQVHWLLSGKASDFA